MMDQRRQLVYPLAQTFLGPEFMQQGDNLPLHQECVAVSRILPGARQS
jgi:hypothetical protein